MTMSPMQGLTSAEPATRLVQVGPNAVVEPKVSSVAKIARRFWEAVPWMLEDAIILRLAIGERLEALVIAVLLIFNVALGGFQEGRAGEALSALKSKLGLKAFVKRDGQWIEVPAATIVPGDVVRLALGGVVPADARLLEGSVLLDQSMPTGESVAVEIGPGSALVRRGADTAEVTGTGQRTFRRSRALTPSRRYRSSTILAASYWWTHINAARNTTTSFRRACALPSSLLRLSEHTPARGQRRSGSA